MRIIALLVIILFITACEGQVMNESTELDQQQAEQQSEQVTQDTRSNDAGSQDAKEVDEKPTPIEEITGAMTSGNSFDSVEELTEPEMQQQMALQACNLDQYFTCVDESNDQCYSECPLNQVSCPPENQATAGCFDWDSGCIEECDQTIQDHCLEESGCTEDDL